MNISAWRIVWEALKGALNPWGSAGGNIADYVLGRVNESLAEACVGACTGRKDKLRRAFNTVEKALGTLHAFAWLVPTRWQTAFNATVEALERVTCSLSDMKLTTEELAELRDSFKRSVAAWKGPDDDTCLEWD